MRARFDWLTDWLTTLWKYQIEKLKWAFFAGWSIVCIPSKAVFQRSTPTAGSWAQMLLRRREFTSNPQIYHHRRVYRKAIPTLIDVLFSTPLFVERDRFVLLRPHCYLMLVLLVALYSAISEPEWKLSAPWMIIAMYQPWSSKMRTKFFLNEWLPYFLLNWYQVS